MEKREVEVGLGTAQAQETERDRGAEQVWLVPAAALAWELERGAERELEAEPGSGVGSVAAAELDSAEELAREAESGTSRRTNRSWGSCER